MLELGGSDPFIVLPDADIDAATAAAIFGRMQNSGQVCTASKRFIVLDEVYDKFVEAFTRAVADLTVGDPSEDVAGGLPRVSQNWRIRHRSAIAREIPPRFVRT